MFTRPGSGTLTIYLDGRAVPARDGDCIAAALLANGIHVIRNTAVSGAPRGPCCMMGVCFDCVAVVDGRAGVQTCMTRVREGMRIECQHGAHALSDIV